MACLTLDKVTYTYKMLRNPPFQGFPLCLKRARFMQLWVHPDRESPPCFPYWQAWICLQKGNRLKR